MRHRRPHLMRPSTGPATACPCRRRARWGRPRSPATPARSLNQRALREQHNFDTPTSQIAAILHRFDSNPESSKRDLGLAGKVHHNTAAKIVNAYLESQLVLSNTRT